MWHYIASSGFVTEHWLNRHPFQSYQTSSFWNWGLCIRKDLAGRLLSAAYGKKAHSFSPGHPSLTLCWSFMEVVCCCLTHLRVQRIRCPGHRLWLLQLPAPVLAWSCSSDAWSRVCVSCQVSLPPSFPAVEEGNSCLSGQESIKEIANGKYFALELLNLFIYPIFCYPSIHPSIHSFLH